MGSDPDPVATLARLLNITGRQGERFDWPTVENSIGKALPNDYKELVETFPRGRFQGFIGLIRPAGEADGVEFLGYYAQRLEDMRRWRRDEPNRFPYPIFPEDGGLLPWAITHRGDLFFWLTKSPDPDKWPVVTTDYDFTQWQVHQQSASAFLIDVVTGNFDSTLYEIKLDSTSPRFHAAGSPQVDQNPPRELAWGQFLVSGRPPDNDLRALSGILGRETNTTQISWPEVERGLGGTIPSDYKAFIDRYGPGMFDDLVITAPSASGDANLITLLNRVREEAVQSPIAREMPFYPERGGFIAWGYTAAGWLCGWAPLDLNPDNWIVISIAPKWRSFESDQMSFSTFLVKYADPDYPGILLGREAEIREATFTPYIG